MNNVKNAKKIFGFKWYWFFLPIIIVFILISIGGGGSGGGIETPLTQTPKIPRIDAQNECVKSIFTEIKLQEDLFDSSCSNSDNTVSVLITSEGDNVFLTLRIHDLDRVSKLIFSYGFYLIYDSNVLEFIEYVPDEFLGTMVAQNELTPEDNGFSMQFNSCDLLPGSKEIVIGHSLLGSYTLGNIIGISGNNLGKIKFKRKDMQAEVKFSFAKTQVYERSQTYVKPKKTSTCWPKNLILLQE